MLACAKSEDAIVEQVLPAGNEAAGDAKNAAGFPTLAVPGKFRFC